MGIKTDRHKAFCRLNKEEFVTDKIHKVTKDDAEVSSFDGFRSH